MKDKIVFIGDSLIANFKMLNNEENIANLGIGGDKTLEIIGRLKVLNTMDIKKLFLLVGINDYLCNQGTWENAPAINIEKSYDFILDYLKRNLNKTKIHILSILPVNIGNVVNESQVNKYNNDIKELNEMIKELAIRYDMDFIDVHTEFVDTQGRLRVDLTIDGIHLNDSGYELFYKLVNKNLKKEV